MTNKKKISVFNYTSNCIICGKEFQGTSDHKNRKSQTCTEDACVSKLRSVRQLERRPQDEESKRKRIIERLNKKIVRQDSGCAFWTGCLNACGYGTVGVDGKTKLVHRVIYELYFGPIPEGMVIAHKCDQPACCEITHLFLTDVAGNVYDMIKKGRCKRTEEWNRNNGLARKGMQTRLGAILSDETKKKLSKSITEWNKNRRNVKKNCKFCGIEFIGLPNQLHCSRSCKEKLANKNKREREIKIIKPTRICKFCGKEFHGPIIQTCCSKLCKAMQRKKDNNSFGSIINCKFCGKEFVGRLGQLHCSKLCGSSWAYKNRKERDLAKPIPLKICKLCGKEFIGLARQTYCSKSCINKKGDKKRKHTCIRVNCIVCGKEFDTVQTRHLNRKNRTTCSKECRGALMSKVRSSRHKQLLQN